MSEQQFHVRCRRCRKVWVPRQIKLPVADVEATLAKLDLLYCNSCESRGADHIALATPEQFEAFR